MKFKTILRVIVKIITTPVFVPFMAFTAVMGAGLLAFCWLFEIAQSEMDLETNGEMIADFKKAFVWWFTKP